MDFVKGGHQQQQIFKNNCRLQNITGDRHLHGKPL
jgi:hypothetical protein